MKPFFVDCGRQSEVVQELKYPRHARDFLYTNATSHWAAFSFSYEDADFLYLSRTTVSIFK